MHDNLPSPITTKKEMYRRLNAGLLGHTLLSAETIDDAIRIFNFFRMTGRLPLIARFAAEERAWAIRSKLAHSSCLFNLSMFECQKKMKELGDGNFNFSPMLDDTKRVCYGHLSVENDFKVDAWNLLYTTDGKPARLLQSKDGCEQKYLSGRDTRVYLRSIMDDIGWKTLLSLVENYPNHCIEFSVMESFKDAFGPTNTIIWEVRCLTASYERAGFKLDKYQTHEGD